MTDIFQQEPILVGINAENQALTADTVRDDQNDPYRGGARKNVWQDWEPQNISGDDAIGANQELMNARVQDLFRNEPVIRNIRRQITKGVIGQGIQAFADVLLNQEEFDDDFNFESDELFERWADSVEADADGRLSWWDIQKMHFDAIQDTGESFLLRVQDNTPGRVVPLCYQVLEKDQIDETQDWPEDKNGVKCIRGVEYRKNRPIAYHVLDAHPADSYSGWTSNSTRVPANRISHDYLPNRPSEHRGVSWFSANVQSSKDLDWYLTNELRAAALGAALALVVKSKGGAKQNLVGPGQTNGTSANGTPVVRLGTPFVANIGEDDEVKVAESNRPNRDAKVFVDLLLQLHGMASGVSKLRVTGDYAGTSYTAARGAHLDDQSYFKVLQGWAGRSFVLPVRNAFTAQAAALGKFANLSPRQFRNKQFEMTRVALLAPGREQLDPEKETGAAKERIAALLSTHQIECGLRGLHWRRLVMQAKREQKTFSKHKVVPDLGHSAAYLASREARRAEERNNGGESATTQTL
jgi:lambda family phage portal protein